MDPLSITAGVGGLIDLCLKAGFAIKAAREGSKTVASKINLLEGEIRGYSEVLQLMSSTLQDPSITASFQSTGHIGNHWRSILGLIEASSTTVERITDILENVDKPARIMGSTRKHFRLMFAADEIEAYQNTVRTYRDTMQISLQTIILWNQVSDRPSSDVIAPTLDDLTQLIRTVAMDIKSQISSVRNQVQDSPVEDQIRTLEKMKSCVETAGDVVSSASTTLGLDDRTSVEAPSDLGDIFGTRSQDYVMRWINESQTGIENLGHDPTKLVPNLSTLSIEDTESDDDLELELEIVRTHLKRGRELAEKGRWPEATRTLERGYARFRKHEPRLHDVPVMELREEIRTEMLNVYNQQKSWEKVRELELENLTLHEQRVACETNDVEAAEGHWISMLDCMLNLAETYLRLEDAQSAKKYAKKCVKGYKDMGEDGLGPLANRLLDSCWAMASACQANNEPMEEEEYALMYDELKATMAWDEETKRRARIRDDQTSQQLIASRREADSSGDLTQPVNTGTDFVHVHVIAHDSRGSNVRELISSPQPPQGPSASGQTAGTTSVSSVAPASPNTSSEKWDFSRYDGSGWGDDDDEYDRYGY
ncbi:hypothetical protein V8F33_010121 [Rhypophila sp. PSN 637]